MLAENTMVGSIAYRPEDVRAVTTAMADGKDDIDGWVSGVPLEGVADALRELRAGRHMKVLVKT